MMRTVIVEDEPLGRDLLRSYLAHHPDLDLVGEAGDGDSGLRLVRELEPDLLLLDVQLPGRSGVALAQEANTTAAIVFITAHDAHAIAAFELGAFDYLLKPVLPERFGVAMQRVRERRMLTTADDHQRERLQSVGQPGLLQRFFVRHLGRLLPVHVEQIVRLEADDDYTALVVGGQRLLVHLPLRQMALRLDPQNFVRVHRGHIVNLAHVRSATHRDRRVVLAMSDGSTVTTSRSGVQAVQAHRL